MQVSVAMIKKKLNLPFTLPVGTITQTLQSTETYVLQEKKSPNINTLKLLDERRKK